ncbi:hypothetical protein V8C37DRAFT_383622 [Trichoderma ceciliae]
MIVVIIMIIIIIILDPLLLAAGFGRSWLGTYEYLLDARHPSSRPSFAKSPASRRNLLRPLPTRARRLPCYLMAVQGGGYWSYVRSTFTLYLVRSTDYKSISRHCKGSLIGRGVRSTSWTGYFQWWR